MLGCGEDIVVDMAMSILLGGLLCMVITHQLVYIGRRTGWGFRYGKLVVEMFDVSRVVG